MATTRVSRLLRAPRPAVHRALLDADAVTVHEGLPDAVSPADNETGWRLSLDRLSALVADR